jgi:hypothetical protein
LTHALVCPRIFQRTAAVLLLLCIALPLFGQTSASDDIFRKIDAAVRNRSTESIAAVLSSSRDTLEYPQIEARLLSSVRTLVVDNELDFALEVALAVIDANLDNYEAVVLYTSIEKAIAKRDAALKAAEEKKQIEAFRQSAVTARAKEEIRKEYKIITNTKSGETIYLDQNINDFYLPFAWGVNLGIADIAGVVDESAFSVKYGLYLDGYVLYRSENFSVGADFFADFQVMSFSPDEPNVIHSIKFMPMFSFNKLSSKLFFRAGYSGIFTVLGKLEDDTEDTTMLPGNFNGLAVGVGFRDVKAGRFLLDGCVDYNLGAHFAPKENNLYTSIEAGLNATLILADLDKADVGLNMGVKEYLTVSSAGVHSQSKLVISIGVGNNE